MNKLTLNKQRKEKSSLSDVVVVKEEEEDEEFDRIHGKKMMRIAKSGMKRSSSSGTISGVGGSMMMRRSCQGDECTADLSDAKQYHRKHRVCDHHSKAQVVLVSGLRQRFCQQCSRFHELTEFDDTKRSCRRRLAGHNERRRKNSADPTNEGRSGTTGTTQSKDVCGQVDDTGRIRVTIRQDPTYNIKHFQIS